MGHGDRHLPQACSRDLWLGNQEGNQFHSLGAGDNIFETAYRGTFVIHSSCM